MAQRELVDGRHLQALDDIRKDLAHNGATKEKKRRDAAAAEQDQSHDDHDDDQ
jgi:hypothetical protein